MIAILLYWENKLNVDCMTGKVNTDFNNVQSADE